MKVTVENVSSLERRITVSIPAKDIDAKTEKKLKELGKTAKLAGFRPGKVPFDVIKQRYGDSARADVIGDEIQASYIETLTKEKLQPAGQPHIDTNKSTFGEPLEYTATFEVYPEIKLKELTGQKLDKLTAKLADKDVDNMIEKLRQQRAEWVETKRAAKVGDQAVIDFEGKIKGELFEGGSSKDTKFELGAGTMLEDFDKGVQGAKAGDTINVKVKFPKDYHGKDVAGKTADFAITVHKVLESKLPEIDAEFLKAFEIEKGGVTALKKMIQENMEKQLEQAVRRKFKDTVIDKLLELNPMELPKALIDNEIEHLQKQTKQQFMQYTGQDNVDKLPDLPREQFEEEAKKRVSLSLILSEFIQQHKLQADKEKVKNKINEMAAGYKNPDEVVKWYYNSKENLAQIESVVLEEQVFEELMQQVTPEEKVVSYEDVING